MPICVHEVTWNEEFAKEHNISLRSGTNQKQQLQKILGSHVSNNNEDKSSLSTPDPVMLALLKVTSMKPQKKGNVEGNSQYKKVGTWTTGGLHQSIF